MERRSGAIGGAFAGLRRAGPALASTIPGPPRTAASRGIPIHGRAAVGDRLARGVVGSGLAGPRESVARPPGEAGEGGH